MKEEEEDNIDRKFKEGLSKAEDNIAFRNDDWDAMEKMLDEEKRRKGIVFYLPRIITGIAALLLLTLGFFFLRPANKAGVNKNDIVKVKPSGTNNNPLNNTKGAKPANNNGSNSDTNSPSNNSTINTPAKNNVSQLATNNAKPTDKTSTYTNPSNGDAIGNGTKGGLKQQEAVSSASSSQLVANIYRKKSRNKTANGSAKSLNNGFLNDNTPITGDDVATSNSSSNTPKQIGLKNNSTEVLAASGTTTLNSYTGLTTTDLSTTDKQLDKNSRTYAAAVIAKQKKKSSFNSYGPTHALVLSVLTAPDLNGVGNSFSNAQVGSTSGLMLSVGLTHRLTVSTGALYAKKPYSASFDQYSTAYQFKIQPTNVYADCRVLDIPINIDYRLYSKGRNMIAVGTGISSYFMLRENYRFDYDDSPGKASTNFDIKNQNQHLLGVLNLNATYQRRINANFGLNVQPYMKLPLTSIGYGKVDLQSTGVAIGFSWYLTSNRPK